MLKVPYILLLIITPFFVETCVSSNPTPKGEENITRLYDLSYGQNEMQTLDIFLPKNKLGGVPMVVLLHGGAWCFGEKETLTPVQKFLSENGIPSANINYRLNRGDITYKEQLEDIGEALHFLRQQTDSLKLPCRFILFGESAGAHLALLYGYKNPDCIDKIISLAAPTDFFSKNYLNNKLYHWYTKFFFELAAGANYTYSDTISGSFKDASPINVASQVPTLIFQGTSDIIVDVSQALSLDSVLTKRNVPHKLVLMEGGIHIARRLPWWRDKVIYPEILAFLQQKQDAIHVADN